MKFEKCKQLMRCPASIRRGSILQYPSRVHHNSICPWYTRASSDSFSLKGNNSVLHYDSDQHLCYLHSFFGYEAVVGTLECRRQCS
jgi:hypothetical protein